MSNAEAVNEFGFVGTSLAMQTLYEQIENVGCSRAPVFIYGETGTGKELCAQAVHQRSGREGAFIPVNCGAIPEALVESELFGHLKGSFTGAIANRDGAARLADGGTLFLDEICELPYDLQAKLLRFLQTGLIQPVGAGKPQKTDVRIVCATNRDPRVEMREGRLREDLFYRLYVLPLKVPALRVRGADVHQIAAHFLKEYARVENKPFNRFGDDVPILLENYNWPGNVRELQNVIRQVVVMNSGSVVERDMLSDLLDDEEHSPSLDVSGFHTMPVSPAKSERFQNRQLWQIERDAIEAAIVGCNGSVPQAAEKLGVSPSTIYRKREMWKTAGQAV